jgi:AraC family transcriptional regulator, transcriptional activator FtrA
LISVHHCSERTGGAQLAELPIVDQIMPKPKSRSGTFNPLVVALAYDGLCAFEFSCTAEVFGLSRPELGPGWYRFETCTMRGRKVTGQYGLSMEVDGGLDRLTAAGTVMIPGWQGVDVPVPPPIIDALRTAYRRGARLLSICSGSFVLAATGLLDGKRATTHWRYAEELRRRYPRIQVDPQVLYVDEGQILTSAGSAAGLDLCLHLVRRDYGPAVANQVARRLVIAPHRDGGQAQFLERPVDQRESGSLSALLDKMRRRLGEPLRIAEMARLVAMSERTFMRRFRATTGMTPADWITQARVDRARELLESTDLSIDHIVSHTGLGTATTLRHHFRRKVGVSPVEYRRRFSQTLRSGARGGSYSTARSC